MKKANKINSLKLLIKKVDMIVLSECNRNNNDKANWLTFN